MLRKMSPNDYRLRMTYNPVQNLRENALPSLRFTNNPPADENTQAVGGLLAASFMDKARKSPRDGHTESPLSQLKNFRKEFQEQPELYRELGIDDAASPHEIVLSGTLGDLEYTKELPKSVKHSKVHIEPFLSHASAFGTQSNLKNVNQKEEFRVKFLPFFCNLVERKMNKARKVKVFSLIKYKFHARPKQGRGVSNLERIIKRASNRFVFETMQAVMETDTILTEKLKQFYRTNLKRILFTALKEHKSFQRTWIDQVRETIKRSLVFDVLRRNAYLEKMGRKAKVYHKSRIFAAWKKMTAEDRLEWRAIVDEFQSYRQSRLVGDILVELRSNALAGKQERKRDMEAIMQYQKVRLFRIFEFWKNVSLKRKKPVDLSKYRGMNSIPIRVTQKKSIELLDDNISKVLKTVQVTTSYKLMPPTLKI